MRNIKISGKKLLAVIMALLIAAVALPIAFADEEAESMVFGSYSDKPIEWDIIDTFAVDGNDHILLASKDVVLKKAFNSKAVVKPNYKESELFTFLNDTFYNTAFSETEKSIIVDRTVSYNYNAGSTTDLTADSVTCKVSIPSLADFNNYSLAGPSSGTYWLCDGVAGQFSTATQPGNFISVVKAAAGGDPTIATANQRASTTGVKVIIEIDSSKIFMTADVPEHASLLDSENKPVSGVILDANLPMELTLTLDEGYDKSDVSVKLNGTELEAADGKYTIAADTQGILTSGNKLSVTGVVINPADYTTYNDYVARANAVHRDKYTADELAALDAALATDVSNLSYLPADQNKVNRASLALKNALDALTADNEDGLKTIALYKYIMANDSASVPTYSAQCAEEYGNYLFFQDEGGQQLKQNIQAVRTKYDENLFSFSTSIEDVIYGNESVAFFQLEIDGFIDEVTPLLEQAIEAKTMRPATNIGRWEQAVANANALKSEGNKYKDVDEFFAECQEVIDRYNAEFADHTPVITETDKVKGYIDEVNAIIARCHANSNLVKTSYDKLDAALAKAATYVEDNYYKDDEMEGGSQAWTSFKASYDSISALYGAGKFDRDDMDNPVNHAFASQADVDSRTVQLEHDMEALDKFVRINGTQSAINKITGFLNTVRSYIDAAVGIFATLRGIIPMLFRGEINLYEVAEMVTDNEKVLNFLIKIGIKPREEPVEEPAENA